MRNTSADMCEGPLFGKIVRYTIPIMLTGLLQLLFNAADLVVVGRFCGSVSVAAVGATGSLINLIVNLFIGLSVGAGVSVAHAIGERNDTAAHDTVHAAVPTAFISGVVLTVIGITCSGRFLELMGTPEDVIALSSVYMKIYFCGMTSSMLYNYGGSILRAAGDTKSPLIFLFIAGVVNVLLNLMFVVFFRMDVAGVALATALSQTLSAVLVLLALTKREDACRLRFSELRLRKAPLLKMLKIGLPAGIQGSLFSISNVTIQSSVNSFGSVVMSGNAASQNLEGFVYTSMNSFHQTALNFTGQNFGAKKYDRLNKIMFICLGCVAAVGIVFGSVFTLAAKPLLSVYLTDSAEAISYGMLRMTYICLPYFLCGIMDVMTGTIRGIGVSLTPMIITVLGVCVFRVGWIYTVFAVPAYHTLNVLYVSYPISWVVTFTAELAAYLIISKTRKKKMQQEAFA